MATKPAGLLKNAAAFALFRLEVPCGFNRRKMEDQRRDAAEKEAAALGQKQT